MKITVRTAKKSYIYFTIAPLFRPISARLAIEGSQTRLSYRCRPVLER